MYHQNLEKKQNQKDLSKKSWEKNIATYHENLKKQNKQYLKRILSKKA